jgi:hypothetical protein
MKKSRFFYFVVLVTCLLCSGCRRDESSYTSLDTIRSANDTTNLANKQDTTKAKADTVHSTLPPIAKAIEPNRLAAYLPKMTGWTTVGDIQKEIQIRDTFNRSRITQNYSNGAKTLKIQIDDFAYVPYLYAPWTMSEPKPHLSPDTAMPSHLKRKSRMARSPSFPERDM